jgi:hypothetical protein
MRICRRDLDIPPLAYRPVKRLLRLYPRAWRERYSAEMAAVVDDFPAGIGVALDLLVGAGAAYAAAIRANRILSSAAAYLHGVCVAFLLQAIGFVGLVLISEQSHAPSLFEIGPIRFVSVAPLIDSGFYLSLRATAARTVIDLLLELALLVLLVASLVLVLRARRWLWAGTT